MANDRGEEFTVQDEIQEWIELLNHVDEVYPVFRARGYSRDACLNAVLLNEINRNIQRPEDDGDQWKSR